MLVKLVDKLKWIYTNLERILQKLMTDDDKSSHETDCVAVPKRAELVYIIILLGFFFEITFLVVYTFYVLFHMLPCTSVKISAST
jgi:hypothetical protein